MAKDPVVERLDRIAHTLAVLHEGQGQIQEGTRDLKGRMGRVEEKLEDAREILDGVARAVDKDAVTVLDHERRIRRLEKTRS